MLVMPVVGDGSTCGVWGVAVGDGDCVGPARTVRRRDFRSLNGDSPACPCRTCSTGMNNGLSMATGYPTPPWVTASGVSWRANLAGGCSIAPHPPLPCGALAPQATWLAARCCQSTQAGSNR